MLQRSIVRSVFEPSGQSRGTLSCRLLLKVVRFSFPVYLACRKSKEVYLSWYMVSAALSYYFPWMVCYYITGLLPLAQLFICWNSFGINERRLWRWKKSGGRGKGGREKGSSWLLHACFLSPSPAFFFFFCSVPVSLCPVPVSLFYNKESCLRRRLGLRMNPDHSITWSEVQRANH